jgi:hypothetical protein
VAEVLEALGLSKSTLCRYALELAIKPQNHRGKAWLSGAEVELLTAYARHRGARLSAAEALAAVGHGALVRMLPLSLSSVFEVAKVLGIVTTKGPGPDGRGRVAWIGAADADRITEAAHRVESGEVRFADLAPSWPAWRPQSERSPQGWSEHRRNHLEPWGQARTLPPHPWRDHGDPYRLELLAAAVRGLRRLRGISLLDSQ